jgi:sugar lactone lactonase YvrE
VSVAPDGTVFGVVTSAPPSTLKRLPAAVRRRLGILFSVPAAGGAPTKVAQIDALELKHNYDKADVNPNPYAVLALASDHQIVVDAGANTVYDVQGGQATLLAVLPKVKGVQRVPLSIALGPDGAYYVGELPGEGRKSKPHGARILRIAPGPGPVTPTVVATGLDGVAGLAFGPDGALYATEQTTNPRSQKPSGALIKFSLDGTQRTVLAKNLAFPGGVAVGPDGTAYVANYSVAPARTAKKGPFRGKGGELIKVTP